MPSEANSTIRDAIGTLLARSNPGTAGGFVVIDAGNDEQYVQFSLEPLGLMLFWPAEGPTVGGLDSRVIALLQEASFRPVGGDPNSRNVLQAMQPNHYALADDGVYAQFGRAGELVEQFTIDAFRKIYGSSIASFNARVEE